MEGGLKGGFVMLQGQSFDASPARISTAVVAHHWAEAGLSSASAKDCQNNSSAVASGLMYCTKYYGLPLELLCTAAAAANCHSSRHWVSGESCRVAGPGLGLLMAPGLCELWCQGRWHIKRAEADLRGELPCCRARSGIRRKSTACMGQICPPTCAPWSPT